MKPKTQEYIQLWLDKAYSGTILSLLSQSGRYCCHFMQVDDTFATIQTKAETLTPFAVEIRYPDDFYMPTEKEAREAYAIATEIQTFVLARLGGSFILPS